MYNYIPYDIHVLTYPTAMVRPSAMIAKKRMNFIMKLSELRGKGKRTV